MKSTSEIIAIAKNTIRLEGETILGLDPVVDKDFTKIVQAIFSTKGRVVITGIGKSAIVAQKIVATLNSTGTPALFMHAADAVHGDLGLIQKSDIVICISKSGNTPEIKALIPMLKAGENILIGMTADTRSYLAENSHYLLHTPVEKEACPNNLAPTSSTTAQMVMGDVLAVCLLEMRGFSSEDFARYHPGGALGKRLYLRLHDIVSQNECPAVQKNAAIKEVIFEITKKRLGATAVLDGNQIIGVITDGDIRRMLEKSTNIQNLCAQDIMSPHPISMEAEVLAVEAAKIFAEKRITQLIITRDQEYIGMVHFHDLNREGIL